MTSSRSSRKRGSKTSFKDGSAFDLFYQLTYMSAMASAGITRSKTFELAAAANTTSALYFKAINRLVNELRFDYPEACRRTGVACKSDNMRSFLLRLSDALRSGEPLADFLAREAEVMSEDYENRYERNLESLKQWSNAFSSIVISVALIVIIQVISAMIYSMDMTIMSVLVTTGVVISALSAWIIWRSAPQEVMVGAAKTGSKEQKRTQRLMRLMMPLAVMCCSVLVLLDVEMGWVLMLLAAFLLPVGVSGLMSDKKRAKKDEEFSTFLRSVGSMATSSGTTLKEALTRLDLSSFPYLEPDILRMSQRLQARVDPKLCWHFFGLESGSKLVSQGADIFYSAIQIGGDPERVGYICSLFVAKTTQLRAKRRLTAGTFSGLTTVMQAVIAGLMVFVLSIVQNFADMVAQLMPATEAAQEGQQQINMGMAQFSAADLQFLSTITVAMVVMLALVSAAAIILSDGGYKLKAALYLALTIFISGLSMIIVPPMVGGILTM